MLNSAFIQGSLGGPPRRVAFRAGLALLLATAFPGNMAAQAPNQIVGMGYGSFYENTSIPTVSPGQIVTLFTVSLGVPDAAAGQVPLPTSLSGVSVAVRVVGANDSTGYPALLPILRIYSYSYVQEPTSLLQHSRRARASALLRHDHHG